VDKQKWLDRAEIVDAWRVFPRLFNGVLLWLLVDMHLWYSGLEDAPFPQYYVIAVWGAIAVVNKFYIQSGRAWGGSGGR
jgi:hypothetical protein